MITRSTLLLLVLCIPAISVPATASPDQEMADRLVACAACHGKAGRSADEAYYPSIAGKPAGYLRSQLLHFKAGRRTHRIMADMLTPLSDTYLEEIAAYYAVQAPARRAKQAAPASAHTELAQQLIKKGDTERNIPPCATCHGKTLKGVAPAIPGLLGLRSEYLAAQLGAWRAGVRRATAVSYTHLTLPTIYSV